jgi:hypothetical protein
MTVMAYRKQDGLADYRFSIEFQPWTGWRVYIIFRPFHQDLNDSAKSPHQSIDDSGRRYVNWSAKLDSLGEARTVAELWAEMIQRYEHAEIEKRCDAAADTQQSTLGELRTDAA